MGKGLVAEKPCEVHTGLGYLFHDGEVVEVAADVASGVEAIHLFAQIAAVTVFHESHVDGLCESEEIFPLAAFLLGGKSCGFDGAFGESGKVIGREPDLVGVELFEHILPEKSGQFAQTA